MLFAPKEKGQGLVEYAIILALIAIVGVGLPSASVLLVELRCIQESLAKARIAGPLRVVRGRLPPAGGANRPAPVASRTGTLVR
jgi:Flp pilus assembly pilin Flp